VVLVLALAFTALSLGVVSAYFISTIPTLALASPFIVASLLLASSGFHLLLSSLIYVFRARRGVHLWPCGCPLCSITARRLAELDSVSSSFEGSLVEDVVEPVVVKAEVVETTSSGSSSPSEAPSQPSPQPVQQVVESDGVLEALSSLENEVKSLKSELTSSLEEFRNSITAIKSEVDELGNPFNFMRSVAEFLDEETRNAILTLASMASGEGGRQVEIGRLAPFTVPGGSRAKSAANGSWSFLELLELLLWLDEIYGSKDWDDLKEIMEVIGSFRVVPEVKLRTLRAAMIFVERSRAKGESISGKIRLLYMLARQLGVTGGEWAFKLLEYTSRGGR
jgi:hypothetical protein